MPATLDPETARLVEDQVAEILARRGGAPFTLEDADRLDTLEGQIQGLLQDRSFGRIISGPSWIDGISVIDATIGADKLTVSTIEAVTTNTGSLNVTGTITAAASYPAITGERVEIAADGLTIYNASDQAVVDLNVDGSGTIGLGSSQISWTAGGAVTVPNAAISSLTIADIGSGTFNSNFDAGTGRVRAGTALERVEITSSGLTAYDTGGTQTFNLSSADGSLTHTGTHTIRSASSGNRVELATAGLRAYNGSSVQTVGINSSDGSGFLGADQLISWGTSTVTIDGSALINGTVTANAMNVSQLSAISANMGTITAGSITAGSINADTISSGTLDGNLLGLQSVLTSAIDDLGITSAKIASGAVTNAKIDSIEAGKITSGTITSETITISTGGKISLSSSAVIEDADGSTWTQTGLQLKGGDDSIEFFSGSTQTGYMGAPDTSKFEINSVSSKSLHLIGGSTFIRTTNGAVTVDLNSTGSLELDADQIVITANGIYQHEFDSSGRFVADGNIFPGGQLNDYLGHNGSHLGFSGLTLSGSAGSLDGYFTFTINGLTRKIPYYNV